MTEIKRGSSLRNLTASAVCLAMCMALPFLTGQIPQIGNMLTPMHFPVLLCGFFCGPYYAVIVGLIAPPLRFMLFGMPPLFPIGIAMSFELAVYGVVSGLLYIKLPKKAGYIYASLIAAMILGRVAWGIVMVLLSGIGSFPFTFDAFVSAALINAIPGIVLQILLLPGIVLAVQKSKASGDRISVAKY